MSTPHLIDTNVLLRWTNRSHPANLRVVAAVDALRLSGSKVYVAAQNLVEFWNVSTRPEERNDFGLTPARTDADVDRILAFFGFLSDNDQIFLHWRQLVHDYGVSGVAVHDARLFAAIRAHGLQRILTFNVADFRRYDGIAPIHPDTLASTP